MVRVHVNHVGAVISYVVVVVFGTGREPTPGAVPVVHARRQLQRHMVGN